MVMDGKWETFGQTLYDIYKSSRFKIRVAQALLLIRHFYPQDFPQLPNQWCLCSQRLQDCVQFTWNVWLSVRKRINICCCSTFASPLQGCGFSTHFCCVSVNWTESFRERSSSSSSDCPLKLVSLRTAWLQTSTTASYWFFPGFYDTK